VTFECPFDIPHGPSAKYQFKAYLAQIRSQIGIFGEHGEDVGIGFIWETPSGMRDLQIITLSKRLMRALKATGILHRHAEPYFLEQRVTYVRDGEPHAVITLREEN
jgi:hypothetical protein